MDFSVIIPTYRRPALVVQAVESVLRQRHPAAEIIVVSDGPDDDVRGALARYPVRLLEPPHGGVAAARNAGIRAAGSPWISFLDDDDLWHPDHLAHTAEFLAGHPGTRAVNAPVWTFSADADTGAELVAADLDSCIAAAAVTPPRDDVTYLDITGRSFDLLLERNRCSINTTTVERSLLLEAGGFPEGYTCGEDWVMSINVARYTEWHVLPVRTAFVRRHATNNTFTRPTNGLVTLEAIAAVWDDRRRPTPAHRPLRAYGRDYRFLLQRAWWSALRSGRFETGLRSLSVARRLLPSARDFAYALVPPPLTWRVERFSLWWRYGRVRPRR